MKKILLSLVLVSGFTFAANAATCEVTSMLQWGKHPIRKTVATSFDQLTSVQALFTTIDFTLKSERTSPDTFVEYIEIAGYDQYSCESENLFDAKNIYNGVKTACYGPGIEGVDFVSISCRF